VQVGAFDEQNGRTGTAHFLEHLAFKGSTVVGTTNFKQESLIHAAQDEVFADILFLRAQRDQGTQTAHQTARLASLQDRLNFLIEQGVVLGQLPC
jgi:predicted Zn-dependent peptidase